MASTRHQSDLRKALHLLCGSGAFLVPLVPVWVVLLLLGVGAVVAAAVYRAFPTFPLFRPGESVFSGAVSYALGVGVALALFPREAAFVGWVTLAVGDAMATLVGCRWPVRGLGAGRTLGGTLAFLLAAWAAVFVSLAWLRGGFVPGLVLPSMAAAVAGAVAEVLCGRIDDNLVIPSVAAGAFLLLV